ncbi:hypothetical protein AGMMS50293_03460 [Spirochaetia bacterium]|nr:hypothetical protein AGMMS50293_03460 [Spirochaetia bacterium]
MTEKITTNAILEALILYVLLFVSGSTGQVPAENFIAFQITAELTRIILYNIPSLALIWYLFLKNRNPSPGIGLPNSKDLLPGLICLPALILIGFIIALISPYFSKTAGGPTLLPPYGAAAWIILSISCISTGYLEESFFRFYILSRREELGLNSSAAILVSVLSFAVCHLYEGPWGFLNAVLSGTVLAFVFLRYRSLHGIALAHGLYNIFVYIAGAL